MGGSNSHIDRDIITSNNVLATNGCDLDLDVYNLERLGADVHLNKTRIDGPVELSETRNETNGA